MVIVAAVDRSNRSSRVIHEAVSLARVLDETVHVVHSLTRSAFVDIGTSRASDGDPITMDEVRAFATNVADEALENADVDTDSVEIRTVGIVGDPEETIVEYAGRVDARYIVVLGRKRSPTAKVLFGSVAQSILLEASCPVVTPGSNAE